MSIVGAEPPVAEPPDATVELVVGRIARAHGLRGDVVVDVRTDEPAHRFVAGTRFDTREGVLELESTKWHGARLVARFAQVADRDAAERLRGIELQVAVPVDERPDDPEEFYDHQLRGLAAYVAGERAGTVTDVLHLPGQELLVLDLAGREVLVPFVAEIVTSVRLAERRVDVSDRPGLLSEPDEDGPST